VSAGRRANHAATGRRPGWGRGFIGVPAWLASALILGALLAVALTILALIPPAQRPTLEPPSAPGTTAAPTR